MFAGERMIYSALNIRGSDNLASKSVSNAIVERRVGSSKSGAILSKANIDGGSSRFYSLHDEAYNEEGGEEAANEDEANVLVGEAHGVSKSDGNETNDGGNKGCNSQFEAIEHVIVEEVNKTSSHKHVNSGLASLKVRLSVSSNDDKCIMVDVKGDRLDTRENAASHGSNDAKDD